MCSTAMSSPGLRSRSAKNVRTGVYLAKLRAVRVKAAVTQCTHEDREEYHKAKGDDKTARGPETDRTNQIHNPSVLRICRSSEAPTSTCATWSAGSRSIEHPFRHRSWQALMEHTCTRESWVVLPKALAKWSGALRALLVKGV